MTKREPWSPEWLADYRAKQHLRDTQPREPVRVYGYVGDANANDSPIPTLTDVVVPGPAKYRNKKTGKYASGREAKRAQDLHLLERAGEITELREQVSFLLIPAQRDAKGRTIERACHYIADFTYKRRLTGSLVVEDAKSEPTKTPAYVIKRKLMLLVHKIRVTEV